MNIIFGGNGFVGKNLILDGLRPKRSICDLLNYDSVLNFLKFVKTTYVNEQINIIHMAANAAGFIYNKNHNVEMLDVNSRMSFNLVKAIKDLNIKSNVTYVGSVCSYKDGNSTEDLIFNDRPNTWNYGYGIAKRAGISAFESLQIDCPDLIKFCCLIPSNMYGEFDDFNPVTSHVIPSLIRKMKQLNEDFELLGNCNNIRDFLYVKDFTNILVKTIGIEGIYNISSNHRITMKDLAILIKKLTGFKHDIIFSENGNVEERKVDSSKLQDTLGIQLQITDLEIGLKNTIHYFETNF